jgi:hypothetical protein
VKGRWQVFWLEGEQERTIDLDEGDVVNVPIGIYRGFRSLTDAPDALLMAIVGGPDAGKVDWHPLGQKIEAVEKTGILSRSGRRPRRAVSPTIYRGSRHGSDGSGYKLVKDWPPWSYVSPVAGNHCKFSNTSWGHLKCTREWATSFFRCWGLRILVLCIRPMSYWSCGRPPARLFSFGQIGIAAFIPAASS